MKKALVTGANGFLGSAVCKVLSDKGIEIIAVVRNEESDISKLEGLKELQIIHCALDAYEKLPEMVGKDDIDVFYHFAWDGTSGVMRGNYEVQIRNVKNSCSALKACKEIGCKRFVFAASIMEYEISLAIEKQKHQGINSIYSVAKLSCDYINYILAEILGIEYLRCVISNIYGPGENSPRLINTCIRKLLNGEHCALSAGEQLYDFIFISDAAEMFVEIGEKGKGKKTYYIGSGIVRKLKDYLLEMKDVVDENAILGFGEIPFDGVSLTYKEMDMESVKQDIRYEPKVCFSEGIRITADWIRG